VAACAGGWVGASEEVFCGLLPALVKTIAPTGARGVSTEKTVGTATVVGSHTAK
jgi:hypothetical protein